MQLISRLLTHKRILYKKYASTCGENCAPTLTIKDIPRRKTLPVIGNKLDFIAARRGTKLHEYIHHRHKQLGPVFREKLGGSTDLVFISDPVLIRSTFLNLEGKYPIHILPAPWVLYEKLYGSKRGLFFLNGEEWLENRRIMNKCLLKEGSEKWLEAPVKTTVGKFIEKMRNVSKNGTFVPHLESEFYRFSIDVIMAVMLGDNSSLVPDKHYDALLSTFTESVKKIFQTTAKLEGLPLNLCQKLNLKVWRDFKESVDISLSLAHNIVAEILHSKQHTNGLVKMLSDESISDENIKKIIGDFVIAAGDTTAYTTLWTLFLLSNEESLKAEIRGKDQNYMNCVLKESMRLYPVAPFLTRILPKESLLGPYKLDAGTPIIASIYTSGREESYFSQANKFLPYRWDRNDVRKKDLLNHVSFASLPFALGARSCIGKKLAVLQITELVSQIVKNFDLKCLNKEEIKADTSLVLVPSTDIKLVFSPLDTVRNN